MRWFSRIAIAIVVNGAALLLAAHFIYDFELVAEFRVIAVLALILTGLNMFVKPLLALILSPVIVLTLGLALIAVNALILWLLDILSRGLTIHSVAALLYASLLVSIVNFLYYHATKK